MDTLKKRLEKAGHYERPIGFHKDTGQLILLKDIIDNTGQLNPLKKLNSKQKIDLVVERWKAGEWSDLFVGHEFIDLKRALEEVAKNTTIGQGLIKNGVRAVEMLLEDVEKAKKQGEQ